MGTINSARKLSNAWETWNIIVTMLEVGLEKLKKDSTRSSPIIHTWEVWGSSRRGEKRKHSPGTVHHVFRLLNTTGITIPIKDYNGEPIEHEVRFTKTGLGELLKMIKSLKRSNRLEMIRTQVLTELLEEFDRNVDWTIPQ